MEMEGRAIDPLGGMAIEEALYQCPFLFVIFGNRRFHRKLIP